MIRSTEYRTKWSERWGYALYFLGQNIFFILLSMYLVTYFNDIGIPAMVVSAMLLVVKIWDAVNDPIFGGIVDKVQFKKGKFLPWVRASVVLIPITTILLFAIPSSLPSTAKIIWGIVAYVLWDTAYTICDVPIFGLVTTITDNVQERTSILSYGRVFSLIAGIIVSILVPLIRAPLGWFPMVLMLSILSFITMLPICFSAKERSMEKVQPRENVSLKAMFSYLGKNKYLLIMNISIIVNGAFAIGNSLLLLSGRYMYGNEEFAGLLSLASMVPLLIVAGLTPMLCRKIDKFKLYHYSMLATILLTFVRYFIGYKDLTLVLIISAISAIPMGFTSVLCLMFTPDCVEYGHYKLGYSFTGISMSVQTFSNKFNVALAGALSSFVLGVIGFVSGEGAVQAPDFADKLFFAQTFVPMVGVLIAWIILLAYKLNDHDVALMARCNSGEITKEEANASFKRKYD